MWFFLSVPASVETINVKHKKTKTKNFKKRWKNGENISKKICNRWRKKNEIPNKWKWLIVRKIIDCNPCTTTLIFFVLSISILSVNDAKTRLKKSFKNVSVLPFKLLWYWQIGNKNIESIFKTLQFYFIFIFFLVFFVIAMRIWCTYHISMNIFFEG